MSFSCLSFLSFVVLLPLWNDRCLILWGRSLVSSIYILLTRQLINMLCSNDLKRESRINWNHKVAPELLWPLFMVWFQVERKQFFNEMDEKNIGNREWTWVLSTDFLWLQPYWSQVMLPLKKGTAGQGKTAWPCQLTDLSADLTVSLAVGPLKCSTDFEDLIYLLIYPTPERWRNKAQSPSPGRKEKTGKR